MGYMSAMPLTISSQKTRLTTMLGAVPLLAPKLALYKNDYIPDQRTVIGDLVEADFGGYTAGGNALTWGTVGFDANGIPVGPASTTYTSTTAVTPNLIYGCYLL